MSRGWIKLHRSLLSWEWYTTPNMVQFFVHCLLKAQHAPTKYRGVDLLPGQFVSGRILLSAETGLSEREVRTCIERLKSTSEMTSKNYPKFSVFTINSWNLYQIDNDSDQQNDQQATSKRPASDQQTTTCKNVKKEKNGDNGRIERFAPPSQLEVEAEFATHGLSSIDAQRFLAHHEARGWILSNGRKMQSWKAAVRTWALRSTQYQQPTIQQPQITKTTTNKPINVRPLDATPFIQPQERAERRFNHQELHTYQPEENNFLEAL